MVPFSGLELFGINALHALAADCGLLISRLISLSQHRTLVLNIPCNQQDAPVIRTQSISNPRNEEYSYSVFPSPLVFGEPLRMEYWFFSTHFSYFSILESTLPGSVPRPITHLSAATFGDTPAETNSLTHCASGWAFAAWLIETNELQRRARSEMGCNS